DRTHFVASGFNPRSTEINSNLRSSGSTYIKGYGLLRRKQEPPRSRARMREESEDIPKASQEQIQKHQIIGSPPGRGERKCEKRAKISRRNSQEQIQKHQIIGSPPGRGERKCEKRAKISRRNSQEQIPKHQNIDRTPGKS